MPTIDKFMVARGIELAQAGRHVAVNLSADSINDPDTITAILEELRGASWPGFLRDHRKLCSGIDRYC